MLPAGASVVTDDLSQYPRVPLWYRLSRNVTAAQEQLIHDLIRITPIYFGIVTDISDSALALRFSTVVMTTADETAAIKLAQQIYDTAEGHPNRSIIVTGDTEILTAVYEDREEPIHVGAA
jgi:hypothetical protein